MIHGVSTRIAIVCSLLVLLSLEHGGCAQNATLPVWGDLRNALIEIAKQNNSGFGNNVWAVTVNNYGEIDQVVYTGAKVSDQWFASRTIAATKAFTAFSLSSDSFAISTANVYGLSQPNGTLYGIQSTSPIDTQAAYKGCRERFGTERDPLRGQMIGGITVIAGGLALYDSNGTLIGGLGVSGDTACTDHLIAWKLRHRLQFDFVSNGFGGNGNSSNSNTSSNGSPQIETTQCSILGNLTNGNSVDLQCSAVNFTFFNCQVTTSSSSSSSGSSPTTQNNTIEIDCPSQTSSDVTIAEQPIVVSSSSSQSVPVRVSRSSSNAVLPSNTNSDSTNGQYDNLVHGSGACALCYPVCDQAASEMLSRLLSDAPVSSR